MKTLRVLLPALVVGLASCQVAYYAAMEQFGIEKRDLLKKAVAAANADNASDIDKAFGRFFEIDPAKAPNLFDDMKLWKQFHALMKRAKSDEAEISPETLAALEAATSTFEAKVPAHVIAAIAAKA